MNSDDFEFGLDSPAYVSLDASGEQIDGAQVVRNTVEEAVLADEVGIDSYNLSEHYRADFMDSAGAVMLAAMASRTKRIRLGTAVTVLSTQDPVRVFTEFSTLDAVSDGRAQIIVGRGSLTDSFPLFGFDLADYETLFEEKLDLFTRLVRKQPVTWSGTVRSSLKDQYVMPPLPAGHLPTWVGVGGSPVGYSSSKVRSSRYFRRHWRTSESVRAIHRALPPSTRRVRARTPARGNPLARIHRQDRPGGQGHPVPALGRHVRRFEGAR